MSSEQNLKFSAGLLSTVTALTLLSVKLYFAFVSNSIGLFASALDSLFDLLSSLIIFFAIIAAHRPADDGHRYGHGKAEAVAGLFQGFFIALSAFYIIYQAIHRIFNPVGLDRLEGGMAVMLFSMSLTTGLVLYQGYVARRTGSIAVKADRIHYLIDIVANFTVLISLAAEKYLSLNGADIAASFLIAIYILKSNLEIFRESMDVIMDRDMSHLYRKTIQEFVASNCDVVLGYHDLRSRSAGHTHYLELHLEIDNRLSFTESHSVVESLITELRDNHENVEATIHSDPVKNHFY